MTQHFLVAMMALGMAFAFWSADRRAATSQALAVSLGALGAAILFQIGISEAGSQIAMVRWSRWSALAEAVAMAALLEWLLRVRQTLPAAPGVNTRAGDRSLRVGQGAVALYLLLSLLLPELRVSDFLQALETFGGAGFLLRPGFWLFALPMQFAALAAIASILLLLNRRPDRAERIRVIAMAVAVPIFMIGFVLPHDWAAVSTVVGEVVVMVGAVHYHVLQGQRGQFMSRFLSPQVAKLVSERGMKQAMQENLLEISVVCCDLRGFTAFAAAHESSEVLRVLREYYDEVGEVVGRFGGTIKDFAGDGILILVGAPIPVEHHARCALEMARRIRHLGLALTRRWSTEHHPLGIGVGVATGVVTVGVIGSASRLEYTAVGATVNLASRLCGEARNGEILIDRRTVALAGEDGLQTRPPIAVKGLAEPVSHFALFPEAPVAPSGP